MKKLITVTFALFLALGLSAQQKSGFGIHAGLVVTGLYSIDGPYQEFETKSEFLNTEEFGKISGVGSKNNVSMLLKRATTPIKEYDKRAEPRRKRGLHFINCLRNSNIEYLHISPKNIYKNIKQKNHLILKQKIWIFKGVTDIKIQKFKELWKTK